ncbi:MAG: SRPBCC family protein [Bacteroidota bacterium]
MKVLKIIIVALIVLPALFFLVGFLSPTITYENNFRTKASLQTAWEVFIDESKMKDWISNFKSIKLIEGSDNEVGSRYEMTTEYEGQTATVIEKLTAYKEQEQFAFELETEYMTIHVDIHFSPDFDGSEFRATHEVKGKNAIWRSMFRLMKSSMAQQSHDDYQKLKRLMDAEAS